MVGLRYLHNNTISVLKWEIYRHISQNRLEVSSEEMKGTNIFQENNTQVIWAIDRCGSLCHHGFVKQMSVYNESSNRQAENTMTEKQMKHMYSTAVLPFHSPLLLSSHSLIFGLRMIHSISKQFSYNYSTYSHTVSMITHEAFLSVMWLTLTENQHL